MADWDELARPTAWHIAMGVVLLVLSVVLGLAWLGLTWFRRDWARRAASYARRPDVELAFGPFWVSGARTLWFVLRRPSTLRWGLVHVLHFLIGVDPVRAVDEREVERTVRDRDRESARD